MKQIGMLVEGTSKEAIKAARDTVMTFFKSERGDEAVIAALKTFQYMFSPTTNVSHCIVTVGALPDKVNSVKKKARKKKRVRRKGKS